MKRKALTLILALILCLSCALPASAAGQKFTDVPDGAWYAEAVNAMAEGGVLNGRGDGTFDPDAPVTLAELSTIYCRLNGEEVTAEGGHWAGSALKRTGLGSERTGIYDEGDGTYPYADNPAYRADAFSLMAGWVYAWDFENQSLGIMQGLGIGKGPYNLADYVPSYTDFDESKIPDRDEYYDAHNYEDMHGDFYYIKNGHYFMMREIDHAYDLGLTHGVDANFTCNAFGTLTRAQLAQMCYNMGWIKAGSYAEFSNSIFNLFYKRDI
ncbi:MAG: S-layer homology domain-containing protein [Butyricicoccus sp.]|nr:S-layer homology domain-containing protein [Butyricicoccus sp.]